MREIIAYAMNYVFTLAKYILDRLVTLVGYHRMLRRVRTVCRMFVMFNVCRNASFFIFVSCSDFLYSCVRLCLYVYMRLSYWILLANLIINPMNKWHITFAKGKYKFIKCNNEFCMELEVGVLNVEEVMHFAQCHLFSLPLLPFCWLQLQKIMIFKRRVVYKGKRAHKDFFSFLFSPFFLFVFDVNKADKQFQGKHTILKIHMSHVTTNHPMFIPFLATCSIHGTPLNYQFTSIVHLLLYTTLNNPTIQAHPITSPKKSFTSSHFAYHNHLATSYHTPMIQSQQKSTSHYTSHCTS